MFSKLIRFHLIPIIIALTCTFLAVFIIGQYSKSTEVNEVIEVSGAQIKHRGKYANLLEGDQAEVDLLASIKKTNQLTVFGSSELSLSNYASYHFLPDSMGMATMGFGHAYHQNLSILMELLAANEYLEGSDICIVLSPGWFTTNGTNVEAFIEFARPNLLNKILHDSSISNSYKKHIGRFINNHYSEIDGVSNTMEDLKDLHLAQKKDVISEFSSGLSKLLIGQRSTVKSNYTITLTDDTLSKKWDESFTASKERLLNEFVSGITSNDIYVYDDYFSKYLEKPDGSFDKRPVRIIELEGSEEYTDFLMVLQLLKERNVNASFVLQPFNPYFYEGLVEYQKKMDQVAKDLDSFNFPYVNMYVSNKEDYVPGTLKDVMHLGDYGWMTINEFLISVYND